MIAQKSILRIPKWIALMFMMTLALSLGAHGDEAATALQAAADSAAETVTEAAPLAYDAFMESAPAAMFTVNNLWILISAALVFIMHLGFASVESGLTQSKNTVNILFKNVFVVCMGLLTYALWGFNAMYPGEFNGFFALGGPIPNAMDAGDMAAKMTGAYANYTYWSDFIFQAMFAATAATIVSGAVAERIKLSSFMVAGTLLVLFIYPITGSWEWGGGWLNGVLSGGDESKEFIDFAGSSLVHAFGGFAALAAVLVLGPRKGKYGPEGSIRPILGHSMPLATIGVFMLFLGWFGFNGGSVLSADPAGVSLVFVTTGIAAAAGGMSSMLASWILSKKPDLSMVLNGILAGLVGITAGADSMGPWSAVLVGAIAGVIVVFSIIFFDRIKIDDPVGAISVHGICGIWGTLAVGIFGGGAFLSQLIGTLSVSAFAFLSSLTIFSLVKVTMGLRVSAEEEFGGLDVGEHGQEAYPDFSPTSR